MVRIGHARARAQLHNGVLRFIWPPGSVLWEPDALAAVAALNHLSAGMAYPLLVELTGVAWVSCKAQNVFAASSTITRVALLGSSPADRVVATFYIARHSPQCPTRYFTSINEAMTWLTAAAPEQ